MYKEAQMPYGAANPTGIECLNDYLSLPDWLAFCCIGVLAPAAVTSLGDAMQLLAANTVRVPMRMSSARFGLLALALVACQGGS